MIDSSECSILRKLPFVKISAAYASRVIKGNSRAQNKTSCLLWLLSFYARRRTLHKMLLDISEQSGIFY